MTEYTRPATWDDLVALVSALEARDSHYAIRVNDEITVDVMPAACGHGWEELKSYVVRMELADGLSASVLSLEGLLLTKEGLRDKDRADRAVLLKALGKSS